MPRTRQLIPVLLAALLLAPAGADAKSHAAISAEAQGTKWRLVVTLSGSAPPASARPRAVTVRAGRQAWKLAKPRARSGLGRWTTKAQSGRRGAAIRALVGKKVTVTIRTRQFTSRQRLAVAGPQPAAADEVLPVPGPAAPATPAPVAPQGKFARPASELTGMPAFEHFKQYFLNSVFTDCPAGWPSCAVEERYLHCQSGAWEYKRLTPVSGADVTTSGAYEITGASAHPDGSWDVDYMSKVGDSRGFYSWKVTADGVASGAYQGPGGVNQQTLGPMQWMSASPC